MKAAEKKEKKLQYAIQVENIRFNYDELEAVKGISFEVAKGEIFGFLGPNGAGNLLLLKC